MGADVGPKMERRKKYGKELNMEWRGKKKQNLEHYVWPSQIYVSPWRGAWENKPALGSLMVLKDVSVSLLTDTHALSQPLA